MSDRLKVMFDKDHNMTVDGPEAIEVYELLKEHISRKSTYFEMTHEEKNVVIVIDKIKTMEYLKGE